MIDCERGSYGVGCIEHCGHCLDVDKCSHINGSCSTGCDAGYYGGLCKKRKLLTVDERKIAIVCIFFFRFH